MDIPVKVLFAGPMGSGKTTALRCLSDVDIVSTDVAMFDGATEEKSTTTVAIDYSTISLDDDTVVHLYGIPGQSHFDFMRPIVADGALGAIVLLDATSRQLAEDCTHWVSTLLSINPQLALVVGVSKTDLARNFVLDDVRRILRQREDVIPLMCVDPRNEQQCIQLIRALLLCLDTDPS